MEISIFFLVILAFSGLLIWGVMRLLRRLGESRGDSALEVLRRRYAAGEITKEQLDQMRKDLEN